MLLVFVCRRNYCYGPSGYRNPQINTHKCREREGEMSASLCICQRKCVPGPRAWLNKSVKDRKHMCDTVQATQKVNVWIRVPTCDFFNPVCVHPGSPMPPMESKPKLCCSLQQFPRSLEQTFHNLRPFCPSPIALISDPKRNSKHFVGDRQTGKTNPLKLWFITVSKASTMLCQK